MTYKVKLPVVQVDILTPSSKLMRQKERLDAYKFHSDLYMYVSEISMYQNKVHEILSIIY